MAALTGDIVADARRASDIIARIRGMALKREPDPRPLAINDVLDDSLLIVRHEALDKAIDIRTQYANDLPAVLGDRVQLQQVFVNLLMNAIQSMAMQAGGARTLTVASGTAGDAVDVSVDDSGPGIPPENLDHLFSGFFTPHEYGMGMGLPICRSIVQAHGGRISAGNTDGGARFIVSLPVH